ncbi:MAG: glycoside hydrolase family 172 protein [Phycisphaerales bacterium]
MLIPSMTLVAAALASTSSPSVTFTGLLSEMTDRDALARLPVPEYRCLQASSYNRASVARDQPGWFADSDGEGFVRVERIGGADEWVLMEHAGPGCITKMWTPFFYRDFNERVGPHVRIYLDGSDTPVIDESLIALVSGQGSIPSPFAVPTARAGDCYLPIPFGASCKVTMTARPFYFLINYRAYPAGTSVETFAPAMLARSSAALAAAAAALDVANSAPAGATGKRTTIDPGRDAEIRFDGPAAVRELVVRIPAAIEHPGVLRSTVLIVSCDDEECVWCPLGDFFSCADAIHPFATIDRRVSADGSMTSRWVMPFRRSCAVRLRNLASAPLEVAFAATTEPWSWDDRSLHFFACWRPDDVVPGAPFSDWNFVEVQGEGVYVGDAWTVLNPQRNTWWGEGDEKIYVDDAWERGFPTHFGTGSEDYYGWAGGVIPSRDDEFSRAFLANVRVGGLDGTTQGYNICTRTRGLDAIPFSRRLRFDMESSFGVDMRTPHNHLGYSAVTFFYARPGATHNRPAAPTSAAAPIMSLRDGAIAIPPQPAPDR